MSKSTLAHHPWEDRSLAIEQRVEDLLARMPLTEKAGLLFHPNAMVGSTDDPDTEMSLPPLREMITATRITHFAAAGIAPSGREFAQWQNAAQRIAAEHSIPIPITFSSDPRQGFTFNPATSYSAGQFSLWPEPLGIAAVGSESLAEAFGNAVRQEYAAVGLRVALHPQLDLATEPRWSRVINTFGEDATLATRMALAYLRGLQSTDPANHSVAGMIKHFPGGGPQKDGHDPHFDFGREQVYPGGQFEYHLQPFRAAIAQGVTQLMPYYGMPVGTEYEEVGFAFNRAIITDLLRGELGYDGIVCSDWGILTDDDLFGQHMPARAWGLETLTPVQRAARALDAGIDQFGGEADPKLVLDAVRQGLVTESRIDTSARRLLREKFKQGLFDNALVDEDHAAATVGREDLVIAGHEAQRDALTLLTNTAGPSGNPTLPLNRSVRITVDGIDPEIARRYATVVTDPTEADYNLVRVKSPRSQTGHAFVDFFATGSLAFTGGTRQSLETLCRRTPTVLIIFAERPVVLDGLEDTAAALLADFGSTDAALLDVLFGDAEPLGTLPVEFPRSVEAVEASREDAPFDTINPTFRFGHGLRYATGA